MPIFDYKCPRCLNIVEVLMTSKRKIQPVCPFCRVPEGVLMERQLSAPNFSISGFSAKNGYSK
jgi:putative FmdB family regulatory protein